MRLWVVGATAFVLGCGDAENPAGDLLPSQCLASSCASIDNDPTASDFVIDLDADAALISLEIDGLASDYRLLAGVLVLTASDPSCVSSSNNPCSITLQRLRLELSTATIAMTTGDVQLADPVLSLRAPLELVDSGSGYIMAAGTDVQTCTKVEGRADSAVVALASDFGLNLEFARETLSLDLVLPLRFHFAHWQCRTFDATVRVTSTGRSPWTKPSD